MILPIEAISLLAFSQLMLLGVYFTVHYKGSSARLIALYSFCLGAYTLTSINAVAGNPVSLYILFRLATLTPFILWTIAYMLFVDGGKIHFTTWLAIGYFVVARGIGIGIAHFYPDVLENYINWIFIQVLPQIIMLLFSAHSIYLAIKGYKNDLVEQRRKLRVFFVVFMGALLMAVVGSDFLNLIPRLSNTEFALGFQFNLAPIASIIIFAAAIAFCVTAFRLSPDAHSLIAGGTSQRTSTLADISTNKSIDPELFERVRTLMEKDRFYAQTGLTISDLADALSMQEYRVRHLINQQLKYKNFNQFLNNYRIEDAAKKLRDKENAISWIALDVGYASLSVFNKAFKERFKMTPTSYRNSVLMSDTEPSELL